MLRVEVTTEAMEAASLKQGITAAQMFGQCMRPDFIKPGRKEH